MPIIFAALYVHEILIDGLLFANNFDLNFMLDIKSAILPELKKCQNGTFKPAHRIKNFWAEWLLLKCYEDDIYKTYS